MAREIRKFEAKIPAGTAKTAPVTIDVSFPPRVVTQINVRVPPGPNGNLGFQIAAAGNQVIPINLGQFIVANDDRMEWPLTDYIDSGDWQVVGYNTGAYDHTIYVTFLLDLVTTGTDTLASAPPIADLSTVPTQSAADTAAAQASIDALLAELAAGTGPS